MARRERPPSPRAASARVVHFKLRLYSGKDDDMIAFFDAIVPRLRAALVKQTLRSGNGLAGNRVETNDETFDVLELLVS